MNPLQKINKKFFIILCKGVIHQKKNVTKKCYEKMLRKNVTKKVLRVTKMVQPGKGLYKYVIKIRDDIN